MAIDTGLRDLCELVESSISCCTRRDVDQYEEVLVTMAAELENQGNPWNRPVRLLAAACHLHFNNHSRSEPLTGPYVFSDGSRSLSLGSFTSDDLDTLSDLRTNIADADLRARIGDILWLTRRDIGAAGEAVAAYLESALTLEDADQWTFCWNRYERAFRLVASLGKANDHLTSVLDQIYGLLERLKGSDPSFLSAKLIELLLEHKVGDAHHLSELASLIADRAEARFEWERSRRYRWLTAGGQQSAGMLPECETSRRKAAETFVQEAALLAEGEAPDHGQAAHLLQRAIEAYRRIGTKRPGVRERITELHGKLLDEQREAVSQLKPITMPIPAEAEKFAKAIEDALDGKPFDKALHVLAGVSRPRPIEDLREQVESLRRIAPLQYLISSARLNASGKVVATRPPLGDSPDTEPAAYRSEMMQTALSNQLITTIYLIEPGRRKISAENRVSPSDFFPLLACNPFVPPDRLHIFAEGLYRGLYGEFLLSSHLLSPQLENSIRYLLNMNGVIVSSNDKNGIQDEHSLNRILEVPELGEILGDETVFDLECLLVNRFGSNIRNLTAHGLLGHDEFYSAPHIYLWWTTVRLVLLGMLAAKSLEQGEKHPG